MKLHFTHNPKYANFLPRAVAFGIDELVWSIPVFWAISGWAQQNTLASLGSLMLIDVVYIFIPVAVFKTLFTISFVAQYGVTLGKLATGLTVLDRETHQPIGFWKAILREMIAKPANSLFAGFSYLLVCFDPEHQAIHDKAAGTVVRVGSKQRTLLGAIILTALVIFSILWSAQIGTSIQKNLPFLLQEGRELLLITEPAGRESNQ